MPIGVPIREKDQSLYVNSNIISPVLAIIGTATKGPINKPTLCTSQKEFKNKFGVLDPTCYGTYAAQWYLSQVSRIYYVRVAALPTEGETADGSDITTTPAAASQAFLSGVDSGNTEISKAVTISSKELGTFYNGYELIIDNVEDASFDLTIKSTSGTIQYSFTALSLDDTSENYIGTKLLNTPFMLESIVDTTSTVKEGTYKFEGGSNGVSEDINELSAEIIAALENIKSSSYQIDLLTIPGVHDASVVEKGLEACEKRGDTLYIVDPPNGKDYEEVANWANGTDGDHVAFNSSYGACYWSWQYIYDEINKTEVLVPPSVLVAPAIARSENLSKPWYAPAGLTRGLIKNALRSEYIPGDAEVDYLYDSPNCINSIITHESSGLVVWGQKTLWRNDTALDRVNVRRLVTYIKRILKKTCYNLAFEPNDSTTWRTFKNLMAPVLDSIVQNRGLYDYRIVPMEQTVTQDDIDNNRMPAQILIKPTKAAEYIPIDIVLTATGVDFTEYTQNISD